MTRRGSLHCGARVISIFTPALLGGILLLPLAVAAQTAPQHSQSSHTHRSTRRPATSHVGISRERALQIQKALHSAGYLDHASGRWDSATAAAMKRYQKDHHWQTWYVPDARALIALGIGPARDESGQSAASTTASN